MAGLPWPDVKAEHEALDGWVEGPGNENPWTNELFGYHAPAAYCISEATAVPHHHGVVWPDDAQNAPAGIAYCPYAKTWAINHGLWEEDRTGSGAPAMGHEGDIYLWDWSGDGICDHGETAMADRDLGNPSIVSDIFGANTGRPEGCHNGIQRPARYLAGVIHMCLWAYVGDTPAPGPLPNCPPEPSTPTAEHAPDGNPYTMLVPDGQKGPQTFSALQWSLQQSQVPDAWGNQITVDGSPGASTWSSLQRYLGGLRIDGDFGPASTKQLQRHLGLAADGAWGSQTTTALQKALNTSTF